MRNELILTEIDWECSIHVRTHGFCLYKAHKDVGRRISKLDQLKEFCCSG